MAEQAIPKNKKVAKPDRDPDMLSKRGVPYWFGPDWVRDLNGTIGRIMPVGEDDDVELHMLSKDGNLTYIQGSIQQEFKKWHEDNAIDLILLGVDIEPNWTYIRFLTDSK